MPLIPVAMAGLMTAKGTSELLSGSKFPAIVMAVSTAASAYIIASAIVTSTNVVVGAGAGTFTGRVNGLDPTAMTGLMMLQATATGLVGKDINHLFSAVSFGVVQAMNTVVATGTVIGGGPGTGVGKIIGLVPTALQGIIMAQLAAQALIGEKTALIASAMATGICLHIMTMGTIMTVCVGSFTPPPIGPIPLPAAPGFGRLV